MGSMNSAASLLNRGDLACRAPQSTVLATAKKRGFENTRSFRNLAELTEWVREQESYGYTVTVRAVEQ